MAASDAPVRQPRRGPAPIASFDHDVSDESSPETKQALRLPEIREDPASAGTSAAPPSPGTSDALAPPEQRARSFSTPSASALQTAPRIDISRASSSSHHDSRDSSPELALFAGASSSGGGEGEGRTRLDLGFREDGALDLRSSTEELAFLEPAPGEPRPSAIPTNSERRHSRKDSQGSEAALLGVSGRTSRLSSVGSQCSAHSALSAFSHTSRVSRLSVVSGVSRSPSPHKMLLETSFCGPKPIETDPEICAAAVEERLLEMAKLDQSQITPLTAMPVDARDRREVRTEATVEQTTVRPTSAGTRTPSATITANTSIPTRVTSPTSAVTILPSQPAVTQVIIPDDDKRQKETKNRARAEQRRARPRDRRESREPEISKIENRSKDIIRIKLKPDSEYEDDDEEESERTLTGCDPKRKPASLELGGATRPTELTAGAVVSSTISPTPSRRKAPRDSRTPSPAGTVISRKSSFCSLFKSRETIASPDSPSDAHRRKKSLTEGRSRSRSRDRSATPTSANKIRGSVLSLFRTPRKSGTSPSPSSRDNSPVVQAQRQFVQPPTDRMRRADRLKYYEDTKDGIIHIPLRTPPNEHNGTSSLSGTSTSCLVSGTNTASNTESENEMKIADVVTHHEPTRPASAPQVHTKAKPSAVATTIKPIQRTILPDGSIIIPLHSPTEKSRNDRFPDPQLADSGPALEKTYEATSTVSTLGPSADVSVQENGSTQRTEHKSERFSTSTQGHHEISASPRDENPATGAAQQSTDHRRKERLIFSTHVGSRDQVFSTQFSITKTPSVTSEISESIPSFPDSEEGRLPILRDTHITNISNRVSPTDIGVNVERIDKKNPQPGEFLESWSACAVSPQDLPRDSSGSEPSSEAGAPCNANDVEQRGLVVQESFEDELPYVPTTLPLERSLALPMVPVRERGDVAVARVERPRARAPPQPAPAPPPAPPAAAQPPADKIRIRLPRRPRTTSASGPSRSERTRTRSGSEGYETRAKTEWIDFEEVPERRKQPKRIQTLPSAATSGGGGGVGGSDGGGVSGRDVVFSYVEPEECRCECHTHAHARDDELPLLADDVQQLRISTASSRSSLECGGGGEKARAQPSAQAAHTFTACTSVDLHDASTPTHQERHARHTRLERHERRERPERADRRQH